ncbi:DUF1579 family protein [bacterium]|nr:DUF1579 family protein [bacterium]RQV98240.1 MAG: DUF1579 domain-containing protein [bacterium]
MKKFDFLLGSWILEYRVPESSYSEAMTGTGRGVFKHTLENQYVMFDYECEVGGQKGQAHGIFGWDQKRQIYRYWWFESSGAFDTASCQFLNNDTLYMNWHGSVLRQTFRKTGDDEVMLHMEQPNADGCYDLILEVLFRRE